MENLNYPQTPSSHTMYEQGADKVSTPVLNPVVHAERVTELVNTLWQTKVIANDDTYALAA